MPGYVVWTVIVFAVIGLCCVLGGAMMLGCHVLDRLWERVAARRERGAGAPARRETVEELYGRRWTERDNDLYLTGFDAWRQISPEGNTSE